MSIAPICAMSELDPDLRFLLETITDCPNAHAIQACPLSEYRTLDPKARWQEEYEQILDDAKQERRDLTRHCKYCIRFYGLAQHL